MKKSLMIFSGASILAIGFCVVYYNTFLPFNRPAVVKTQGPAAKQGSEIFGFVSDYIESLRYFKASQVKLGQARDNTANYKDDIEMGQAFMKSFKLANKDLSAAKSLLEKHKNMDNQNIQKSVKTAGMAYDRLMQLNDTCADLLTKEMDKQGHFNLGKYLRDISGVATDKNGLLEALAFTSDLITRALVDEKPDETGHLSYLILASKERTKLINSIDQAFGEGAKESKAGDLRLDTPAAILRNALAGEQHSADER